MPKRTVSTSISISLFFLPILITSLRTPNPCDPTNKRDPQTLRSDQITVLINGYSESRIPLLQSLAATYTSSPIVSSVLVLWGNPATSSQTLAHLSKNLSLSSFTSTPISLIPQKTSSLNSRFLPRRAITTRAVLVCDDDVEVDLKSLEFAFKIWRLNPDRLIGLFVRSHDLDLINKKWIYTVHHDKYSIVLTKFMILKTDYLYEYSCGGGARMRKMREVVEEMRNCEDILMNIVASDVANVGPVLVGAERVRDWGDKRNEGGVDEVGNRVSRVGLSSRGLEHRKKRGECLREFHRLLGRIPLRHSYGKVVNSVGEQGLCIKGGKLVFCDQYR